MINFFKNNKFLLISSGAVPGALFRWQIDDIFLVGVTSNCLVSNDQNLNLFHSPYSETGFWLSPIIRGFPVI